MEDINRYFKEMGQAIVELWQQSAALNDQRLDAIRKAFIEYFSLMEVNYGARSVELYAEARTILNDIKPREITEAMYSLRAVLVEEEIGFITSKIQRKPANYDVLVFIIAGYSRVFPGYRCN